MPGIANAFYYLTNWLVLNREINSLVHEGTINLTMWAGKNSHMGLYCLCNSKCSSSNYLWFCSIEFLSSNCLLFKSIVSIDKIIVVDPNIKDSISNIWVSCQSFFVLRWTRLYGAALLLPSRIWRIVSQPKINMQLGGIQLQNIQFHKA